MQPTHNIYVETKADLAIDFNSDRLLSITVGSVNHSERIAFLNNGQVFVEAFEYVPGEDTVAVFNTNDCIYDYDDVRSVFTQMALKYGFNVGFETLETAKINRKNIMTRIESTRVFVIDANDVIHIFMYSKHISGV